MSTVKKEVEVTTCDVCGKGASIYNKCIGCGKDFCYECKKENCTTFHCSIYFSGSGDGIFCHKCAAKPPKRLEALLLAYYKIVLLGATSDGFYESFKIEHDKAEAKVKAIRESLNLD